MFQGRKVWPHGRLFAAVHLLVIGFSSSVVHGAPAIQGVAGQFSHKSAVTINGSSFGTKAQAAPVIWDDASGGNILEKWDGAWPNTGTVSYHLAYRSPINGVGLPHSNVSRYIAGAHGDNADSGGTGNGARGGWNVVAFKSRTISSYPAYSYWSWYERAADNWVFGGDNNYKTFAYSSGTGTPYNLPLNWYLAFNTPKPTSRTDSASYILGDDSWGQQYESLSTPDENGHQHWWGSAINPHSGVWKKVEIELKYTNQNDGYIKLWENGVLRIDYLGKTDMYPGNTRTEGMGGFARMDGQPNNWRYFSDVYLDYTRARVVLANNQDLSKATIIEPQIPTSWGQNSITISVNLGRHAAGASAYLFVVDASGSRNSTGYLVTADGSSQAEPPTVSPKPPSGVTVQ